MCQLSPAFVLTCFRTHCPQKPTLQIAFIALTNAYAVIMAPFVEPVLLLPLALPLWVLVASVRRLRVWLVGGGGEAPRAPPKRKFRGAD